MYTRVTAIYGRKRKKRTGFPIKGALPSSTVRFYLRKINILFSFILLKGQPTIVSNLHFNFVETCWYIQSLDEIGLYSWSVSLTKNETEEDILIFHTVIRAYLLIENLIILIMIGKVN